MLSQVQSFLVILNEIYFGNVQTLKYYRRKTNEHTFVPNSSLILVPTQHRTWSELCTRALSYFTLETYLRFILN